MVTTLCGFLRDVRTLVGVVVLLATPIPGTRHAQSSESEGLMHLVVIHRHGERAPVGSFPTDPNRHYVWPMGLGQLTTKGRRTMHKLGKYLRKRYASFLSWDPREVEVRSSPAVRCYDSAALLLYGMYPATGPWQEWMADQDWQPVPITRLPEGTDKYTAICRPKMKAAMKSVLSMVPPTTTSDRGLTTMGQLLGYLSHRMGLSSISEHQDAFVALLRALDALWVQSENGLTLAPWAQTRWPQVDWAMRALVSTFAVSNTDNMGGAILR